ncbi:MULTISPECIES: hypothetical protein [Clostridium]|uniref:hypothetical protein n=1 Tax=Clostridium TaxID=1485 RepID=UPI000774E511|nr:MULTISPECIES: hypothetical protein [Clostridium]AUM96139.1 hypothetical protein RSJ11_13660 [Clostridium sporogenes]AVQ53590.1 hypothetical protein C7M59_12275 [Clostridium botulinum]
MNNKPKEPILPNCIKNNLSVKSMDIQLFNGIITYFNNEHDNNDFQILLHTTYGFIKCDICDIAESDDFITSGENSTNSNSENLNVDFSYIVKIKNERLLEFEKENPNLNVCDNGAILNLKNVSIYKDDLKNPILTTNQMLVFLDQIIGFSAIPRNY